MGNLSAGVYLPVMFGLSGAWVEVRNHLIWLRSGGVGELVGIFGGVHPGPDVRRVLDRGSHRRGQLQEEFLKW